MSNLPQREEKGEVHNSHVYNNAAFNNNKAVIDMGNNINLC